MRTGCGEIIRFEDATVHILAHSLHYGFAVFEGIRCYAQGDGAAGVFRLEDHIARLLESAHMCQIEVPFSHQQVVQACILVIRKNGFLDGCYLRPIIYLGTGSMGIAAFDNQVHVAVAGWRWGAYLGDDGVANGIRVRTSSFRRSRGDTTFAKGKISGQYVTGILAKREALSDGFDEAIMLDTEGFAVEGSGENLFIVKNQVVRTPFVGEAILGGFTRETAIDLLQDDGVTVEYGRFTRDEIYCADEVFFTGTAAEVTPVREVDRRKIGAGIPGPITERLKKRYAAFVRGQDEKAADLITRVEL